MADAGSVWIKLGLNTDELVQGLDKAKLSMTTWSNETNKGSSDMLRWGAAFTATIAPIVGTAYALTKLTTEAAAFGKEIKDNARDLGLSTDQFQQWTHVAIAAGSSAEEMTGSIRMLTLRLKEASDPTSEAARYLTAMGVSAFDANGKLRSTHDVLLDILPALNNIPEGMERNQASMVFFGRNIRNVGDLTSLTRAEIDKLIAQAPVFSPEKIQNMDDTAIKMALINEQIEIMSVDLGTDLIPVAQDLMAVFKDLEPVMDHLANTFHAIATGLHWDVQGLQLLYTQWKYGMDSPEMVALQKEVQSDYEKEMAERSGEPDQNTIARKAQRAIYDRANGSDFKVAPKPGESKSDPNAMTAFEILRTQTEMDTINKVTIPEQKLELKKLKDEYSLMGDRGSEAAKKISREIINLNNDIALNINKVAEMSDKLGKAGSPVASSGGSTYNTVFKGSIQEGGVGPDWAGYSDLANMSMSELETLAKGGLGKSKGMAEKAQQYLTLMKASGATTPTSVKKTDPVSAEKEIGTATVDTTKLIATSYTDRVASVKTYGDELLALYITQEQQDLTHWTATTEMMRISLENMSDSWKKYVTFAANFPTIHNVGIVTWTKSGPDWTPERNPVFMQSARMASLASQNLALSKADYGSVAMSKATETKNEVKVAVVVNVDKNGKATATAESTTTKVQQAGIGG